MNLRCAVCGDPAARWWAVYDHWRCGTPRGDVIMRPVCPRHVERVARALTEAHVQCMAVQVTDAGAVDQLDFIFVPEDRP
jgi:hypothetical protein